MLGFFSTENHLPTMKHYVESTACGIIGLSGFFQLINTTAFLSVLIVGVVVLIGSFFVKKPEETPKTHEELQQAAMDKKIEQEAERLIAQEQAKNSMNVR